MFFKSLFALLLLCGLALNTAFAQNPTKVAPTHYKLAFENEHVQVLYMHYGPHEKSVLHEHPAGVVVNLSSGDLKLTDDKGKVQHILAMRGEARWFPALKHSVQNLSSEPYEGVFIGIKNSAAGAKRSAFATPLDDEASRKLAAEVLQQWALSRAECELPAKGEQRQLCFNSAPQRVTEKVVTASK